jgi:hypothetical protein
MTVRDSNVENLKIHTSLVRFLVNLLYPEQNPEIQIDVEVGDMIANVA